MLLQPSTIQVFGEHPEFRPATQAVWMLAPAYVTANHKVALFFTLHPGRCKFVPQLKS
jgi:hypothetical protein